jgi:anti-anti-sigma regulatory factor
MKLRIEHSRNALGTILILIGRITSQDVQELKALVAEEPDPVAFDLQQVRIVDLDAVHYLAEVERRGVELRNAPQYVREWISAEAPRLGALE